MTQVAYLVVQALNVLLGVAFVVAVWLYRRHRNREALETRMIAVLVAFAWLRLFIGLPTADPVTSAAVGAGLGAVSVYLFRPPQGKYLIPPLFTRRTR